jgi:hypothetical protein
MAPTRTGPSVATGGSAANSRSQASAASRVGGASLAAVFRLHVGYNPLLQPFRQAKQVVDGAHANIFIMDAACRTGNAAQSGQPLGTAKHGRQESAARCAVKTRRPPVMLLLLAQGADAGAQKDEVFNADQENLPWIVSKVKLTILMPWKEKPARARGFTSRIRYLQNGRFAIPMPHFPQLPAQRLSPAPFPLSPLSRSS